MEVRESLKWLSEEIEILREYYPSPGSDVAKKNYPTEVWQQLKLNHEDWKFRHLITDKRFSILI